MIYLLVSSGSSGSSSGSTKPRRNEAMRHWSHSREQLSLSLSSLFLHLFVNLNASMSKGLGLRALTMFDVCASWNQLPAYYYYCLIDSLSNLVLLCVLGVLSACFSVCLPLCVCSLVLLAAFLTLSPLSPLSPPLALSACFTVCLCLILDNIIIRCWPLSLLLSLWCHLALYFVAAAAAAAVRLATYW